MLVNGTPRDEKPFFFVLDEEDRVQDVFTIYREAEKSAPAGCYILTCVAMTVVQTKETPIEHQFDVIDKPKEN